MTPEELIDIDFTLGKEKRFKFTDEEIIKMFIPECIDIIRNNILLVNTKIKRIEQEKKKWLRRRNEFRQKNFEWFMEVGLKFIDEALIDVIRKKNKLIRYLFLSETPEKRKKTTQDNFYKKVTIAEEKDILEVIKTIVNDIKTAGINRYKCKCPFHEDKNPSLTIYKDTNSFYCFSCSTGGSPIDFIINHNQCTFTEAVRELNL